MCQLGHPWFQVMRNPHSFWFICQASVLAPEAEETRARAGLGSVSVILLSLLVDWPREQFQDPVTSSISQRKKQGWTQQKALRFTVIG